jgi:hypothetical protein
MGITISSVIYARIQPWQWLQHGGPLSSAYVAFDKTGNGTGHGWLSVQLDRFPIIPEFNFTAGA